MDRVRAPEYVVKATSSYIKPVRARDANRPPPGNASAKDAQFAVQSLDTCIGAQLCTHDDLS